MTEPRADQPLSLPEDLADIASHIPQMPQGLGPLRTLLTLLPPPTGTTRVASGVQILDDPQQTAQQAAMGYNPNYYDPYYNSVNGNEIVPGSLPGTSIAPGSVPVSVLDSIPPAVPTGLAVTSDIAVNSDGTEIVRLIVSLTHPVDADYFGSYIEVTRDNNGDDVNPQPVWTNPTKVLIGPENGYVAIENVAGNTLYWARAQSVDRVGNKSAYTGTVSGRTVADTSIPAIPQGLTATAGFRGVGLSWVPSLSVDVANYQYRWSTDGGTTWSNPVTILASKVFVSDLVPGTTYTFEVQAVDMSGNVSGWSSTASAVPSQIGTADIAAGSITAGMIAASGISADSIKAGKIALSPSAGVSAIELRSAGGALQGSWDPTNGITIYGAASGDYAVFDDAFLSFYKAGVLTAQISPNGVLADSIRLGTLSGGHNVVKNSSFELAAFVTGVNQIVFTDATASPGWKAANRITAPDNVTESTALTATVAF